MCLSTTSVANSLRKRCEKTTGAREHQVTREIPAEKMSAISGWKRLVFVGSLLWMAHGSVEAQVLNFSFDIHVYGIDGSGNTGELTGKLLGLENNATTAPSGVILTSITAASGLGITAPPNYDLLANGWFQFNPGGFTVENGSVTAANYQLLYAPPPSPYDETPSVNGAFDLGFGGSNGFSVSSEGGQLSGQSLINNEGSGGATYTVISVPEPSTLAFILIALGLVAYRHRRALHDQTSGGN